MKRLATTLTLIVAISMIAFAQASSNFSATTTNRLTEGSEGHGGGKKDSEGHGGGKGRGTDTHHIRQM